MLFEVLVELLHFSLLHQLIIIIKRYLTLKQKPLLADGFSVSRSLQRQLNSENAPFKPVVSYFYAVYGGSPEHYMKQFGPAYIIFLYLHLD